MSNFSRSAITATSLLLVAITSNAEDLSLKDQISAVGARISKSADIEAKILITDGRKPEAYVYPDKTIIITAGLIEMAGSVDEIAFVIGHEIGHLTKEQLNEEKILSIIGDPTLPDWKKREIEADINSMNYAKKAGYDPSAAKELLSKMFCNTHGGTGAFSERMDAISIYLTNLNSKE